jgi:nucleoside-triphosphatase THEP1
MIKGPGPLRPADFLFEWGAAGKRLLFLLTGASGAGKTTWCMELARVAGEEGWQVSGLCSPAVFTASSKTGIDVLDLRTAERRRLAGNRAQHLQGPLTHNWEFDESVLSWANSRLAIVEHELFILDELGPLEFEHKMGFLNAFKILDQKLYRLACVVVRPSLLMRAQDRWPEARLLDIGEAGS